MDEITVREIEAILDPRSENERRKGKSVYNTGGFLSDLISEDIQPANSTAESA